MADMGNPEARIKSGLLARLGVSWEPTGEYLINIENAVSGAIALLRSVAGNKALSFAEDDDADLCITCAWYLATNNRAEFVHEYTDELNWLRTREVLGYGTDAETDVPERSV